MCNVVLFDCGSDGFRVEILDVDGVVIVFVMIFFDMNIYESFFVLVDFLILGIYMLCLMEIGDNDLLGLIIDNVFLMICFVGGMFIEMGDGIKCVICDIVVGESVMIFEGF